MKSRQHERLAAESLQQREARLQCICTHRAFETDKEKHVWLQMDRERRQQQWLRQTTTPLLDQLPVQTKMHKFHTALNSLEVSRCSTCLEAFPGLIVCSQSYECKQCSHEITEQSHAAETLEQRVARLQQMRDQQEERHAAETPEQRVAKLQQMRDRHAAETLASMAWYMACNHFFC